MKPSFNGIKMLSATIAVVITMFAGSAMAQDQLAMNQADSQTIAEDQVIVPSAAYYRSFQAVVFKRLNGTVSVNVEKAAHEKITIKVYDQAGQVININADNKGKRDLVNHYYDMSGAKKGTYTFEISSPSKVYRKEVTIE